MEILEKCVKERKSRVRREGTGKRRESREKKETEEKRGRERQKEILERKLLNILKVSSLEPCARILVPLSPSNLSLSLSALYHLLGREWNVSWDKTERKRKRQIEPREKSERVERERERETVTVGLDRIGISDVLLRYRIHMVHTY